MAKQESFEIRWRGVVSGPHDLEQLQAMLGRGEISLMHEALVDGRWVSVEELIQQRQKPAAVAKPTVATHGSASRTSVDFIAGGPTAPRPPQRPAGPPPPPAEDLYHVAKGGQQQGPYTKGVIRQLVAGGVLSPDDLAWKEGMPEWMQINRLIPDVTRASFVPQPPPPMNQPFGTRSISSDGLSKSGDDQVRFGPIIRDIAILWALTAAGGVVAGIATGGPEQDSARFTVAVAVSNFFMGLLGFTIAGCLAPRKRWIHLRWVALGVWVSGLLSVVLGLATISQWVYGIVFIAIIMGLGGALSYAFKPASKD